MATKPPRFVDLREITLPNGRVQWTSFFLSLEEGETIEFLEVTTRNIARCYDALQLLKKQGDFRYRTIKVWDSLRVQRLD